MSDTRRESIPPDLRVRSYAVRFPRRPLRSFLFIFHVPYVPIPPLLPPVSIDVDCQIGCQ
jgi:hypothetical protein